MGLIGGSDGLGRAVFRVGELACDPKGFEVSEGASTAEMAEMLRPVKHPSQRCYGFNLHSGAGAAAIERVVVGVYRHGQCVGCASDGMWRLQHLSGVEWVGGGVVVV